MLPCPCYFESGTGSKVTAEPPLRRDANPTFAMESTNLSQRTLFEPLRLGNRLLSTSNADFFTRTFSGGLWSSTGQVIIKFSSSWLIFDASPRVLSLTFVSPIGLAAIIVVLDLCICTELSNHLSRTVIRDHRSFDWFHRALWMGTRVFCRRSQCKLVLLFHQRIR